MARGIPCSHILRNIINHYFLKVEEVITKIRVQATTRPTTSKVSIKPSPHIPNDSIQKNITSSRIIRLTKTNNIALMSPLLLCAIFSLLSITRAQDRSPHGLAHQNPTAFSPSAFEFFHPDNRQPGKVNPCAASGCSPLPIAATAQSSLAYASRSTQNRVGSGMGAGGIAGIIFGFVFVVLLAMGVYYVVTKRRANMGDKNYVQAEA